MPRVDFLSAGKKNKIMGETWGHLFPEPGSKHTGTITFAHGVYGDLIIISMDFPTP